MSYIDTTLLVNEHVLYRTRTHWIVFASCAGWLVATAILISMPGTLMYLALPTTLLGIYDFFISLIRYTTSEFAVTNKRVLVKVGFIQRHSVETFLQKVEGIQVEQTLFGRIFNYGNIIVCGTGGSRDRFAKIDEPLEFRKQVQQQIEIVLSDHQHD